MSRREDHEVHKGHVGHCIKKKKKKDKISGIFEQLSSVPASQVRICFQRGRVAVSDK